MAQKITPQEKDFPQWYQDVVQVAELAESSEVRGCGIVKPYGYKLWELIKTELASLIEATGAENVYFPIFIPYENLQAEKDHVEGFSPELAVVTHAGGKKLENKLVVRPTSETAMYNAYARWIQSYKDLPLRLNQWNNVVRWEKRPRPFLRWSEFLWQEGHTAFAAEAEAISEMWQMLDVYEEIYKRLGIPVFKGKKSETEKFAGAVITSTVEAMARDGKAIQGATSHHLGQNFAKVFDVKYVGEDGKEHFVYQNSWGCAWRIVGALIMAHGDNKGLRLPPKFAPIQIVVVPIYKDENKDAVIEYSEKLAKALSAYRVNLDTRSEVSPGFKFNEWEVKGVPVRLEVGGKEMADSTVTVVRRDTGEKVTQSFSAFKSGVDSLFESIYQTLWTEAEAFRSSHIHRIESIDQIKDQRGFFEASWCESKESEKLLKEKFSMVSRVLPKENMDKEPKNKRCFITGEPAKHDWLFAKSY